MLLVSSNPKLALTGSILGGELSMLTPHGKANHRLMKIIYSWMLTHKNEIPGLDINLSLLMQADLLTNAQLKKIWIEADPLAGRKSVVNENRIFKDIKGNKWKQNTNRGWLKEIRPTT